jgi:hypothetical protein
MRQRLAGTVGWRGGRRDPVFAVPGPRGQPEGRRGRAGKAGDRRQARCVAADCLPGLLAAASTAALHLTGVGSEEDTYLTIA